nr:MAG TPA: YopX protein [Caudoviricetes sp.]
MIPKFRAWDRTRNEMNYKVLVGNCDTDDENWTCPIMWIEERQDWLHFDDYDSIMQSTGLKDKNGKEIFEGDILTDGHTTGDIRNHPTLGFYTVDESSKEGYLSDTVGIEDFEEAKEFMRNSIEVIGNIYENPELLEEE